jgi:two-component system sensor histidine kinase KdpD
VAVESTSLLAAKWSRKEKEELESNFKLARELGAKTVTMSGRSISDELSRFAKEKHISQIVIGHSEKSIFQSSFTGTTTSKLLGHTKNIAIHVIPTAIDITPSANKLGWIDAAMSAEITISDYWKIFWAEIILTGLNLTILPFVGYQAVGFIYLLAVLVLSVFVSLVPIITFALFSAVIWDFFFIPPFGTLFIRKKEDIIMCIAFIITSVITGYLTSKIRKDQRLLSIREARTETMYRIVSVIAGARDIRSCIKDVIKEIETILPGKCDIFVHDNSVSFEDLMRKNIFND